MTNQSVTRRRPTARPSEILSAALDLFSEKGFSATRMEDVAARAGLSKAGVYLYFDDKMALLQALVKDTVLANLGTARLMASAHDGPVSDLLVAIMGFIGGRMADTRLPELIKVIVTEARAHPEIGHFYLDNVIRQGLPFFAGLIERGIASGEFRAVDPRHAVKSFVAPMLLAAIWRSVFEPLGAEAIEIDSYIRHNQDMLLRGLRP